MSGLGAKSTRGHLPELEGLRAVASLGIVVTHVAFQTGTESTLFARFDYFVAVFFALSAFLLARRFRREQYYRRRFARITPAYVVCVAIVVVALPGNANLSWEHILANLLMFQIYVPDGLVPGLTQLWSLCVEMAFYLVLPAYCMLGRRGRVVAVAVFTALAFAWPWLPVVEHSLDTFGVNMQIWPVSYAPWFAVGLICAELEGRVHLRLARWRGVFWAGALFVAWLAGQEAVGPLGLEHPTPAEFNVRILLGTVFAALVAVPYMLSPCDDSLLTSPTMQALGRWSYSLFLWHMAVLAAVFPLAGIPLFSGGFFVVLALTVALSVVVSFISYELVERPGHAMATKATLPARTTATESPA